MKVAVTDRGPMECMSRARLILKDDLIGHEEKCARKKLNDNGSKMVCSEVGASAPKIGFFR